MPSATWNTSSDTTAFKFWRVSSYHWSKYFSLKRPLTPPPPFSDIYSHILLKKRKLHPLLSITQPSILLLPRGRSYSLFTLPALSPSSHSHTHSISSPGSFMSFLNMLWNYDGNMLVTIWNMMVSSWRKYKWARSPVNFHTSAYWEHPLWLHLTSTNTAVWNTGKPGPASAPQTRWLVSQWHHSLFTKWPFTTQIHGSGCVWLLLFELEINQKCIFSLLLITSQLSEITAVQSQTTFSKTAILYA